MNKETDLIPLEKLIKRFESKILVDVISGVNYQDELSADKSVVYYLKKYDKLMKTNLFISIPRCCNKSLFCDLKTERN